LFSIRQRSGDIVFLGCRLFLFLRFDVWRGSGGCHIVADVFDWEGCRFLLGWRGNMRRGSFQTARCWWISSIRRDLSYSISIARKQLTGLRLVILYLA